MARTIQQIQDALIAKKEADGTLNPLLTSASKVAIWRLWTYICAFCQNVLETFFDDHKEEVQDIIRAEKKHTLTWYETKIKAFQTGYTLPIDSDEYAVIDEAAQIIAHASATEIGSIVRIKVATLNGGVLTALGNAELLAVRAYMSRIKDGGVRLMITTNDPDDLQVSFEIYYDPLVLSDTGARIDGTAATPVQDAVKTFVENLPFNGLFVVNRLLRYVEDNVEGVRICSVSTIQARYGALEFEPVTVEYLPDAGYLLFDAAYFTDNTTFTPHNPI